MFFQNFFSAVNSLPQHAHTLAAADPTEAAGLLKRLLRLMLLRSIPSNSIASSVALSSTLAGVSWFDGNLKVPSSSLLYHRQNPSFSQYSIFIRSFPRLTNKNRFPEKGSCRRNSFTDAAKVSNPRRMSAGATHR